MTLGWGIIGIGRISDDQMAPSLNKGTNTKLVAVCSRSMDRAKTFAAKHGGRAYDSLDKMLKDPELDVLYVCTPNNLHAQNTIQAAEAGKHVFCEKPMTLTLEDAERMIKACEKNKVKLGVNYQHRLNPPHVEARRYIQSGTVGKIILLKAQLCGITTWKGWHRDPSMTGAGTLMGHGIHCVDQFRHFLDSEVTEVRAMTDEELPDRPVDEMFFAILKFATGAHGMVVTGIHVAPWDNDVILYSSKARIICKRTMGRAFNDLGELFVDSDSVHVKMTFPTADFNLDNKIRAVESFTKSIEENTEPFSSGYNGMQMVKITSAILESSRGGKAVKIK